MGSKITEYIGISGHKGAGRSTFTFLLAKTLERMITDICRVKYTFEELEDKKDIYIYNYMANDIQIIYDNNDFMTYASSSDVYITEFADVMRFCLSMLLGVDFSYLKDESIRDKLYINIKTLSIREHIQHEPLNINDIKDINFEKRYFKKNDDECWVRLRDFYIYFGENMFKRHLGKDIWCRLANREEEGELRRMDAYLFRIYKDVKTIDEQKYIKDRGGVIINLTRKTNPGKGYRDVDDDLNDININIDEGIENMCNIVFDTSLKLMKKLCNKLTN